MTRNHVFNVPYIQDMIADILVRSSIRDHEVIEEWTVDLIHSKFPQTAAQWHLGTWGQFPRVVLLELRISNVIFRIIPEKIGHNQAFAGFVIKYDFAEKRFSSERVLLHVNVQALQHVRIPRNVVVRGSPIVPSFPTNRSKIEWKLSRPGNLWFAFLAKFFVLGENKRMLPT